MKTPSDHDSRPRFSGGVRHYHRLGAQPQKTWEEWVDEKPAKRLAINWLRVVLIVASVLILGGIVTGLIVELV